MHRLLFSFFALLSITQPLKAQPHSEYVNILYATARFQGQTMEITYELPCGTDFHGFIFNTSSPDSLRVGVVGRSHGYACIGMPRTEKQILSAFQLAHYKKVTLLHPQNYRFPLFIARATDTRRFGQGKTSHLETTYRASCNQTLGLYIKPYSGKYLAHGVMLMREADGSATKGCQDRISKITLTGLGIKNDYRLTNYVSRARDPMNAFYLHLAPIKAQTLKILSDGNLSFKYLRRCNEAPVGIVLAPPSKGQDKRAIGLLVAHYFNQPCAGAKNQRFASTYRSQFLNIAYSDDLSLIPINPREELTVRQATQVNYESGLFSSGVSISYYQGCRARIGTLITPDANNTPAVAIVEKAPGKQCKAQLKEVSFLEDIFVNAAAQSRLKSFSLEGV